MADFTQDAYNKFPTGSHGTLIGNWHEERTLAEATGEGRSCPQRHIPRSGLLKDFTKTPASGPRQMDNTFERVYGPTTNPIPMASTLEASLVEEKTVMREGPKSQLLRQMHQEVAKKAVQDEETIVAEAANARQFGTTYGVSFTPKELAQPLGYHRRCYMTELARGSTPPPSLTLNNEGLDIPAHLHYTNVECPTIYRMAMADSRMRSDMKVSAYGGVSVFGKHSEFTKPIDQFTGGPEKDLAMSKVYDTMKRTNALATVGGSIARGVSFGNVPSLPALKSAVHEQIGRVFGPQGYVALRQQLCDNAGPDGMSIPKRAVEAIFRDVLRLSTEEVTDMALDVYLSQMCTPRTEDVRISSLFTSLRPPLSQKDKLRVLEAFQSLGPVQGQVQASAVLNKVQNPGMRMAIITALGAQDDASLASLGLSEKVFLEVMSDVAPFVDISSLL